MDGIRSRSRPARIAGSLLVLAVCARPIHGTEEGAVLAPPGPGNGHFEALLNRSPFRRTLILTETWSLRGLATFEGEPVATHFNRATEKSAVVTGDQSNELGLKLVEVHEADDLGGVFVRIAFNGEEFQLEYEPERIAPAPASARGAKNYRVKYDSRGRPIPPKDLIKKFHSMSREQRHKYMEWRNRFYGKYPKLKESADRFPIVDKAIDAIRKGKEPPRKP